MSVDKIQRRVRPKVTPQMKWRHQTIAVQESYNRVQKRNKSEL